MDMKHKRPIISAALLIAACSLAHADPAPAPESVKQLYTDGKYKEFIVQVSRVLAIKGADAAQYDRHELLMLKGEASLRTKQKSNAVDAFKQAAAAATEPNDIAVATATAELVKQASGTFKYQPKTKASKDDKPVPIDIIEPDSRKLAFAALETDMEAVTKPKVDAALKATTLAEVASEARDPGLAALQPIEIAATGTATDSKQMLGDLGHHAYAMMDGTLDKLIDRLKADYDAAVNRNKPVTAGQSTNSAAASAASSKSSFIADIESVSKSSDEVDRYSTALAPIFGDTTDFKPLKLKVSQIDTAVKQLKKAVGG
jgi:hypothetical protein